MTYCDANRPAAVDEGILEEVMYHVAEVIGLPTKGDRVERFNDQRAILRLGDRQQRRHRFTDNTREINVLMRSDRLLESGVVSSCQAHQSID
jgi:hypothetical protein